MGKFIDGKQLNLRKSRKTYLVKENDKNFLECHYNLHVLKTCLQRSIRSQFKYEITQNYFESLLPSLQTQKNHSLRSLLH